MMHAAVLVTVGLSLH